MCTSSVYTTTSITKFAPPTGGASVRSADEVPVRKPSPEAMCTPGGCQNREASQVVRRRRKNTRRERFTRHHRLRNEPAIASVATCGSAAASHEILASPISERMPTTSYGTPDLSSGPLCSLLSSCCSLLSSSAVLYDRAVSLLHRSSLRLISILLQVYLLQ